MRSRRHAIWFSLAVVVGFGCVPLARAQAVRLKYVYAAYGHSGSQRFLRPAGAFYEATRGELYVADTGNGQIVILDRKGYGVAKFPHMVVKPGSLDRFRGEPRSLIVRRNGDILVADNLCAYIDVLDPRGKSMEKLWPADMVRRSRDVVQPRCLATDGAGNIYVGVTGAPKEIIVLGPDLKVKALFGVEDTGKSKGLTSLWVDGAGRIFATYGSGTCVRVFAPDGKQLLAFGEHDAGPENFSLPAGVVTDAKGRLWVLDTLRHVVSVFFPSEPDKPLAFKFASLEIGGMGQAAGELTYPSGIAGDGVSRIFVTESTGARVQAFEIAPETEQTGQPATPGTPANPGRTLDIPPAKDGEMS